MSLAITCEGCGKDGATLQCPSCKKLGLAPSFFCGQDCFKNNWATHKEKHSEESIRKFNQTCSLKTMSDIERSSYKFTGALRPGLITPKRFVPDSHRRPDYCSDPDGMSSAEEKSYRDNRIPKCNAQKLDAIRKCCRLTREVLEAGIAAAAPGVTTDAVDAAVHNATVERGLYPSTLGYMKYPKSCCTSVNEVICHGIPDSTILKDGDILNIDVSCYSSDGVHADMNETIFIGKPSAEDVKLVHCTHSSLMKAVDEIVMPNNMYKHVGNCIAPFAEKNGFSVVKDITGHGVGELFHCAPAIPHYSGNKTIGKMQIGHVFTIEPMINAGTWREKTWPDNWTIVTLDGKKSAQFEHQMAITESGTEIFSLPTRADRRPHYQVQLEEWGIPLPKLAGEEDEEGEKVEESE